MIKRSYILHRDTTLAKRAAKLDRRQRRGKKLFENAEEWEAEMLTDWQEWNKEMCEYIVHIFGDDLTGKRFNMRIVNGDIHYEEDDVCYSHEARQ